MKYHNKRAIGKEKEKIARAYLEEKGYVILEENYFCQKGELDLIANEGNVFVFIEVKYRRDKTWGLPEEAVDRKKKQAMIYAARHYLWTHGISEDTPCRFDVVSLLGSEARLIQDAFTEE